MTGAFDRERVPSWQAYADTFGLDLQGRGAWRTTRCDLHGGSDSLRVNLRTGGWVCMACGAKGGDTLAHYAALTGADFVQAARDLGAWNESAADSRAPSEPRRLSARDALTALGPELGVCVIVISDARRGLTPTDADWQRFLAAAGRVDFIAREATA